MKKLSLTALLLALLILSSCAAQSPDASPEGEDVSDTPTANTEETDMKNPIVTITMDDDSVIKIELYPDKAPNTVANFVTLAQSGFYDGLIFHRTGPTFMIQGGDPKGNGTGGPGYSIAGEFASNDFAENDISHKRGVISMARSTSPDSAGSQFFIIVAESTFLDGEYAAFGEVIEGMEAVDSIASGPNTGGNEMRALEPRTMKTVTVETFGVEYEVVKQ